jgi:hypothetical protein
MLAQTLPLCHNFILKQKENYPTYWSWEPDSEVYKAKPINKEYIEKLLLRLAVNEAIRKGLMDRDGNRLIA